MSAHVVLDGRAIAQRMKADLRRELQVLKARPRLGIFYFGTQASLLYWFTQQKVAAELDIEVEGWRSRRPGDDVTQRDVEEKIEEWNLDPNIHGIFVHQPMPQGIDPQRISALIDPQKDIEGIHPQNSARRFFAKARIGSCTALAVMELIETTRVDLAGKEAVVVGHSEIVGRPVSMLLLDRLATTTICHVATNRLEDHVKRADVLVVAVGKPRVIKGNWIKEGAIVIDVGINVDGGKVVGDVEFETAKERASYITPVPGGVGPVTVMMVMKNTLEAFKLQQGASPNNRDAGDPSS